MKHQRLIAFFLIVALIYPIATATLPISAEAATSGYYTYTVSNGMATITDCSSAISGNITLPSALDGYPVIGISSRAFNNCYALSGITIPDSVINIGDDAFSGCEGLTHIVIGDGVTSIGDFAFSDCSNLTSISFGNSKASIGDYAFYNCSSLASIDTGNGVTHIGSYAFAHCTNITSASIGEGVNSIGMYVFSGCSQLEEINFNAVKMNDLSSANYVFAYTGHVKPSITVNIGANVTRIPASLFYPHSNSSYAPRITTVVFAEGSTCETIGYSAFRNCSDLSNINIPDSMTSIGQSAFEGCLNLTTVTIPDSVTSIGNSAFSNCDNLATLSIGKSVTSIGAGAFAGCDSLTTITIPNCVTSIGKHAFSCGNLKEINFNATDMKDLSSSAAVFNVAGINGNGITVNIGANVTRIPAYLFYPYSGEETYAPEITAVHFVEGSECKSIGSSAFHGCIKLADVYYSGSQEQWDAIVINYDNDPLIAATLHLVGHESSKVTSGSCGENLTWSFENETLTISGTGAMTNYTADSPAPWFPHSGSIQKVVLASGITKIGTSAFASCDQLSLVYFPGTAEQISIDTGNESLKNATWHYLTVLAQDDLRKALSAATQSGTTVMLTQDLAVSSATIRTGITLDLNGCNLETKYFTCYGDVVDGAAGGNGLLKATNGIHIAGKASYLPIYDSAAGGYRFYQYQLQNLGFKEIDGNPDICKVGIRLTLANAAGYDVLTNTTDPAIDAIASIHWGKIPSPLLYTFSDSTLRKYATQVSADLSQTGSSSKAITLTISGLSRMEENAAFAVQPSVATLPGVTAQGDTATWIKQ